MFYLKSKVCDYNCCILICVLNVNFLFVSDSVI